MTNTTATHALKDRAHDDELRARILDWAETWRGHRHSTAPADRPTTEAAFEAMFAADRLPRPRVAWRPSPEARGAAHRGELRALGRRRPGKTILTVIMYAANIGP